MECPKSCSLDVSKLVLEATSLRLQSLCSSHSIKMHLRFQNRISSTYRIDKNNLFGNICFSSSVDGRKKDSLWATHSHRSLKWRIAQQYHQPGCIWGHVRSPGLHVPSSEEQSLNNPPTHTQAVISLSRSRIWQSTAFGVRQTGVWVLTLPLNTQRKLDDG